MQWRQEAEHFWVKLDRGEEVMASLEQFFMESGIQSGSLMAIGALEETELGFFDCRSSQYLRKVFPEEMELVSFLGNITQLDGKTFCHAHAILSGRDFIALAGHFFSGTVAITLECQVFPAGSVISRKLDDYTGLNLIQLS
jgi:uncharacterized protein